MRGLGLYDRVVEYGDAAGLDAGRVAYVDMSGDGALREALHRALGERLALDLIVGFTHHEALTADQADLPGPAPEVFFAPGRAQVRTKQWGGQELAARIAGAWGGFLAWLSREDGPAVLEVERSTGPDEVQRTWQELVAGRSRPNSGHIASLG